jgi:hypothetical protein
MITTLVKKEAKPAIELLRSVFLGCFDSVKIQDFEKKRLAEFLTAEGILMRDEMYKFRMSSIFVDELIRRQVIPVLYKSAPTCAVPKKLDGSLDIINILKMAIQFFDKEIIYKGFDWSPKFANAKGQKNVLVPRESVYDAELNRILVNWISDKQIGFEVNGLCHLVEHCDECNKHTYSDMVIKTPNQIIVLELLATATNKELDKHFAKMLDYAKKLSANEMWIVHFTYEDYTTPYWPSDRKFEKINVVHFFHDQMFENVRMSVRSVSTPGTFNYIDDTITLK